MDEREKLIEALRNQNTYIQIKNLDENCELEKIIPQSKTMKLIGECKYHKVDVYTHSLNALKELEECISKENFLPSHLKEHIYNYLNQKIDNRLSKYELLKLGVFLHDIGKYDSKTVDENKRVHFRGHEIIGADIANDISKELKLNDEAKEILYKYVRFHMNLLVLFKTDNMSKDILYKMFEELQDDIIGIMLLGYADIVATRKLLNPNENEEILKTYMNYVLTSYIYKYNNK